MHSNKFRISGIEPPINWGINSSSHLDFGCGYDEARNPFNSEKVYGVDIIEQLGRVNYLQINNDGKIAQDNESFDSISAFDVIEHLSREGNPNAFITFMNEAFRLLKPNGILLCVTPAYPNPSSFQDPTHVNIITDQTINYFSGPTAGARVLGYGFNGQFELLAQFWAKPRCRIRDRNWFSKVTLRSLFIFSIRNISNFRLVVSGYRKPSHLVWVLRKAIR